MMTKMGRPKAELKLTQDERDALLRFARRRTVPDDNYIAPSTTITLTHRPRWMRRA